MRAFRDSLVAFIAAMLVLATASIMAGRFGLSYSSLLILFSALVLVSVIVLSALSFTMVVPEFQRAAGGAVASRAAALVCVAGGLLVLAQGQFHVPTGRPAVAVAVVVAALLVCAALTSASGAPQGGAFAGLLEQRLASRRLVALAMLLLVPVCAGLGWALADEAVRQLTGGAGLSQPLVRGGMFLLLIATILPGGLAGLAMLALLIVLWVFAALALPVVAGGAVIAREWGAVLAPALEAALEGAVAPVEAGSWILAISGLLIVLDLTPSARGPALARRVPLLAMVMLVCLVGLTVLSGLLVTARTQHLAGQTPEDLATVVDDSHRLAGLSVCGADRLDAASLRRRCATRLENGQVPASEIVVSGRAGGQWRAAILSLPQVAGVLHDLSRPLVMLIAIALLLHRAAALAVHEGLYRLVGRRGTASGRLALQRAVVAGLAGLVAVLPPPWAAGGALGYVAGGLYILAAVPLPLMLLSLWSRADVKSALCALAAAALTAGGIGAGHVPLALGPWAGFASALGAGLLAALVFPARKGGEAAAAPAATEAEGSRAP